MLFVACTRFNQVKDPPPDQYPRVTVKDWSRKAMAFSADFWDQNREEIVKQIGDTEFEKVKAFSHYKSVPRQMTIFDGRKVGNLKDLSVRLNRLKVYKIATFTEKVGNQFFDERVILRCPFSENKDWDSTAKWDTVYFIVKANVVEMN